MSNTSAWIAIAILLIWILWVTWSMSSYRDRIEQLEMELEQLQKEKDIVEMKRKA